MINSSDLEAFGYYALNSGEKPKLNSSVGEMVKEYHSKAKLPIDYPYIKDSNLYISKLELIVEEFKEVLDAKTRVDLLKELADLVYVSYGCAVSFGWDMDEAVRRVHDNNLERMHQDDGSIQYNDRGKVVKNPNTSKVDLSDLV